MAPGGVPTAWLRGEMASYARDMIRLMPPEADIRRYHFDAEAYLAHRQVFLNEKSTYISALLRHRVYSRIMTSRLLQLYPKFAAAQVGVDQAIIALALERYRRERGEFPESLSALVPRWLAAVPPDVFSGQPIPYKRLAADSYRLESTGAEFWLMLSRRVTGVGWVWEWPVKSP